MSRSAMGKPFTVKGEDARGFEFKERLLVHLAMESLRNEMLEAVHGLLIFAEMKVITGSMQRNKSHLSNASNIQSETPFRAGTCALS